MLFSNVFFIFYLLPVIFILYYLCFFSRNLQNYILMIFGIFFYAIGQAVFIFVLLFSILWNWGAAILIDKYKRKEQERKLIFISAVVGNLAVLVFFKQLNPILSLNLSHTGMENLFRIGLPLGLSYYTLQSLSYIIDVYRGEIEAEHNLCLIGLYISFFPRMIVGPLSSYGNMKKQMLSREFSLDLLSSGFCRFVRGLAKVILIGNIMARISDYVFSWSAMGRDYINVPASLAWLGLLAFLLRLYHQLSGFSDMAIGLGMMFQYRLPENFRYPFAASSLMEFWQRWNITVLGWFKNYVYLFLRRFSRKIANMDTVLMNLFFTWFLYALWHGPSWSIMFWGGLQFFFLLVEHFLGYFDIKRGTWYMRIFFYNVIIFSFVFFRTEDLFVAATFYKNLFILNRNGFLSDVALIFLREYWLWLTIGIITCFPIIPKLRRLLIARFDKRIFKAVSFAYPIMMSGLLILVIIYALMEPQVPFNYF